jgi:excisionase family DNA binding protein
MDLPIYISIDEAAQRYCIEREMLSTLIESGKIRAVKVGKGMAVAEEDTAIIAAQMQAERDGDELVSMSEAARRLGINVGFVARWVNYGWLPVLGYGKQRAKLVSFKQAEALARLREKRGYHRGSRLIQRKQQIA